MFGLVVRFDLVDEVAAGAFDELTARTGVKIREEEPGTLLYVVNTVADSPLSRVFYEVYRDESAFNDHEATAHVKAFLEEREQYIAGLRVEFLRPVDGKNLPA